MHVGLNLVYLVPGETGGMETYARELIPALLDRRPELRRFTTFVNREAAGAGAARGRFADAVVVPVRARRARNGYEASSCCCLVWPNGPASRSSTVSPARRPREAASGASSRSTTSSTVTTRRHTPA